MHPYHNPPYQPPVFAPSEDAHAPIQLTADLCAAQLANELHAQLTQLARGRDLRVLRRQARDGFRVVLRHARARRLEGHRRAPLAVHRADPPAFSERPRTRRRRIR